MHHLYLDPLLFACPAASEGQVGFDSFLEGILILQDLIGSDWCRLFITATTCEALYKSNRYPLQQDLHAALSMFNSKEEIQTRDVVEIVNSLLKKLPTLEDYLEVSAILVDGFTVSPWIDLSCRQAPLKDALINMLVLCGLVRVLKVQPEELQISLARGIKESVRKISFRAEVVDAEGATKLTLPFKADSACWLCQCWDDLNKCLDCEDLWMSEPVGPFQRRAVETNVAHMANASGIVLSEPLSWFFGRTFLKSAEAMGFLHEPAKVRMILRACAETLLGTNLRAVHALRTGRGGDNSQRTRGKDKAWRRDVDHEFHLHYWETASGVEFAAVVVHNDYAIPE